MWKRTFFQFLLIWFSFLFVIYSSCSTDINECLVNSGGCSHGCVNTAGSHFCTCPHNHYLLDDKRTCQEGLFVCTMLAGCWILIVFYKLKVSSRWDNSSLWLTDDSKKEDRPGFDLFLPSNILFILKVCYILIHSGKACVRKAPSHSYQLK